MFRSLRDVNRFLKNATLCSLGGMCVSPAYALYLDGEGHYATKAEVRTAPAVSKDSGQHQALEQSFRLNGEIRVNDASSFFLQFGIFDKPGEAYMGDKVQPRGGVPQTVYQEQAANCEGGDCPAPYQSSREPGYETLSPKITQAYARYAFDYCIMEVGRRSRQWGLGLFLDAGNEPFATDASIYDGISCDVNLQKSQTLRFSLGYDKLAETGSYARQTAETARTSFGPANSKDDINQIFMIIEYDDRKANAGSTLTKQVGFYAAKVSSASAKEGGAGTDITFLDLYTSFYLQNFTLKNEILSTLGKTADPHFIALGGKDYESGSLAVNKVSSIALAGNLEWTLARSGWHVGPKVYKQGDASRHVAFLNYAFAPGDAEGYYNDYRNLEPGQEDDQYRALSIKKREKTAKAASLHKNFKPALLLFNGKSDLDDLKVDGVFDPTRVMNAQVYSLGYRYESLSLGNIEFKGTFAFMNQDLPEEVRTYYENNQDIIRPIGFYGDKLGTELDLMYWKHIGRDVDFGCAVAALAPGDAWKQKEDETLKSNLSGQAFITFRF